MDLAGEAAGHMVRSHGLGTDLIYALGLYIVGVFALVVLEVPGPYATPGVGRPPDKGRAQGALGLVHLGAGDLVYKLLVVLQGLYRMGNLYIHGAPHGHRLQVLGSHHAAHPCSAGRVLDTGHHVGKGHKVFSGRADNRGLDVLVS